MAQLFLNRTSTTQSLGFKIAIACTVLNHLSENRREI